MNPSYIIAGIFALPVCGLCSLETACNGVPVPYWDSTLDYVMPDPTRSIVWSDQFFGNGNNMVVTGPFRNFQTVIAMDPITREIGTSALELDNYTIVDVSNILQPLIMMYLKNI